MKLSSVLSVIIFVFISNSLYAKKPPAVQFVNMAPLPGGCYAVNERGKPDGLGAGQINIPVAYTPGDGYWSVGATSGEYATRQYHRNEENFSGVVSFGVGGSPRIYLSAMFVSTWIANDTPAFNFQIHAFDETEKLPSLAFGCQDLANKENTDSGDVANTKASYYAVMTKGFNIPKGNKLYATLGWGAGRFLDTYFGGMSYPISEYVTVAAEYDGFQMNEGIIVRPQGRNGNLSFTIGNNNKAGVLVGMMITGKLNFSF
ncbi:MAG: hypothetical protein SNJ70_04265 [Armatimonadota bacterium]